MIQDLDQLSVDIEVEIIEKDLDSEEESSEDEDDPVLDGSFIDKI